MMKPRLVAVNSLSEHPLSHLVPDMRPSEWQEFYLDVSLRGIRVPIEVLADGTVLDGRHRLRAARGLALKMVLITDAPLNGDDPVAYMLKAAVLRRHLTDDQRALMAAMWAQENKKQGARSDLQETSGTRKPEVDGHPTRTQASADFKVSATKVKEATTLLREEPELAGQVHSGGLSLKKAREKRRRRDWSRREVPPIPAGTFSTIVIDPPWPYSSRAEDAEHRARNPYPSMSIEEIAGLELPLAENAVVWLWTTNAFMHEAYHILEGWGLEPKTVVTWCKERIGLGDWLRGQTEHCILAVRGKPRWLVSGQSRSLHAAGARHSEKPEPFYRMLEQISDGPRLEMFSRRVREGWTAHGDELPG